MLTWLSEKLKKRTPRGIEFINLQKAGPNLGDYLSSPKHYYKFVAKPSAGRIAVIGGGAYNDFAAEVARRSGHDRRILWAVGRSLTNDNQPLNPAAINQLFDACSTRDPEWALAGIQFVPCPSVCHPICDVKPGTCVGLILNASTMVSGELVDELLRECVVCKSDLLVATNAMSESSFFDRFARIDWFVTNSYHAAYWGLLSGRGVTVVGYSSKFSSLLRLLGQESDSVIQYRMGDSKDLAEVICQAFSESPRLRLSDPFTTRRAFRETNDRFAAELVRRGLFQSVTRRPTLWPSGETRPGSEQWMKPSQSPQRKPVASRPES
jgi:hypothetical protein